MQGIYRIRNKVNDKRYVGSAQDFDGRWKVHRSELLAGVHYNTHLQNAWNKYGEENFVFEVEKETEGDHKALLNVEQVYLDEGFILGNLYNIARKAGGGNLGPEVNQKMSQSRSGKNSPMYGKVGYWAGKKRPKHSKRMSGKNNPNYGRVGSWAGKEGPRAALYPSFYNSETGEFVPAGVNFVKLCYNKGWEHPKMYDVKSGSTICARDGWRLATLDEIRKFESREASPILYNGQRGTIR